MQQDTLFTESQTPQKSEGPVTCLGKTFANDAERRAYFTQLLAEKLKDPEFRKIEGFPIGTDEAILNLSDPPYYTACPNPWIADFIAQWEAEKPAQPEGYHYHREPFAADVSEGKNDPIYNAHSYHTKVPHKAIMRYILHYTNPGDIVFDGFCGSGMTGVAAQMCGDREAILSLGYQIKPDGTVIQPISDNGEIVWKEISRVGPRRVVLNDLSPIATFIASNYNSSFESTKFSSLSRKILSEVNEELGWMYKTKHKDGSLCDVDYFVWSEVFTCPSCGSELVFSKVALDSNSGLVIKDIKCSSCSADLKKASMELVYENVFDPLLNNYHKVPKRVIYKIAYKKGKEKFEKSPDDFDYDVFNKVNAIVDVDFPFVKTPDMQMMRVGRMQPSNITHLHHFFLKRPLITLSKLWKASTNISDPSERAKSLYFVEQCVWGLSILARYTPTHFSQVNQYLSGVFYMASHVVDVAPNYILGGKAKRLQKVFEKLVVSYGNSLLTTQDVGGARVTENSVDYVFIDPPFGENIYYSDLNYILESLHGVVTNPKSEAIVDRVKGKDFFEYQRLMISAFSKAYSVLKPGRWMTVEFSNSSAIVWNIIQTSLAASGFVVANVSALDKKQRSFQSVVSNTAVKQDLVISAYKPNGGFENRFKDEAKTEEGVWDFIRTHLQYLPVIKLQGNSLLQVPERDPRILFDQLVAYYVRKGYQLPVSSQEFQLGLAQRFIERDGMFFLDEQAAEYDKKKAVVGELVQASLFVKDEASAIQWLRQLLKQKPQVFSDINPQFMQQLSGWSKNEVQLDLRELLAQNFLCFDSQDEVPEQIHSYLSTNWKELRNLPKTAPELKAKAKERWYVPDPNKAGDLEKLRERSLLKEFEEYKTAKKKLKVLRIEAARVGFKKLFEAQEFASILDVAAKLPADVIAEDPVLLMYYDQAMMLTQTHSSEDW